jgi:hypothetical protein
VHIDLAKSFQELADSLVALAPNLVGDSLITWIFDRRVNTKIDGSGHE